VANCSKERAGRPSSDATSSVSHAASPSAISDPRARALIAAGFGRWSEAIGDGLRGLHAAGQLSTEISPDDIAVTLLAALQGGLLLAQVQRNTRPLETAVDTLLTLITRELTPQ
jgi:TetR/AcrR family transcriptional repressor of nem operon